MVVIAGKGHEQGQEFEGGRKEPFDDVTVAREALRARAGGGRVIDLYAPRGVAEAAGGELLAGDPDGAGAAPGRGRHAARSGPGDLFVGLAGQSARRRRVRRGGAGGRRLGGAGRTPQRAVSRGDARALGDRGSTDPLAALAARWRAPGGGELGCQVVGITGSTGKTSTKDILRGAPARRGCAPTPTARTGTPRSACR